MLFVAGRKAVSKNRVVYRPSATGSRHPPHERSRANADDRFTAWPNERDLIFRDIVQYLVITEYLLSNSKRIGTASNIARIFAYNSSGILTKPVTVFSVLPSQPR